MSQPSGWQRWRAFDRRSSNRMRRFAWVYLTPLIAALVIGASATSVGPSWRAHEGGGTRGMVTVTSKDCGGRGGCSYNGDFVSDDGKVQRTGVGLASGFSGLAVGVRVVAFDDGDPNNVFPPGGGEDWIYVTFFLVGAIGSLGAWFCLVPLGAIRRRGKPVSVQPSPLPERGAGPIRAVAAGPNAGARFAVVRIREGCDMGEVDDYLDGIAAQLSAAGR